MSPKPSPKSKKNIPALFSGMAAWNWFPTLCFAVLPALIVRGKWNVVAADAAEHWGEYIAGDALSWWKAVFVIGIALWMLCTALLSRRHPSRRFTLLMLAAALGVLLPTFLSDFPYTKWIGYTGLYEGAFVLLAYLVALWYAAAESAPEKRLWIIRSTLIVLWINILLGILTGAQRDFWQTEWGAWVIGAPQSAIRHNFAELNLAAGTVYQSNHYGMLMAMLAALALGMAFAETTRLWKYVWGGSYVFAVAALLFSRSRMGMAVLGLITLIFLIERLLRLRIGVKKILLAGAGVVAVAALTAFIGFGDSLSPLLRRGSALFFPLPLDNEITDISLKDNVITVKTRTGAGEIRIGKRSATSWYFETADGRRSIPAFTEQNSWRTAKIPGAPAVLSHNAGGNILLRGERAGGSVNGNTDLEFFTVGSEIFAVDQTADNLRLLAEVPLSRYEFSGYEGIFSARGYIWARSLEKWRERPLFGWGAGALPLVFPNGELLNKERYSFGKDEDKGHSILVTFLVQMGVIGTILYALPFGYAVYAALRSRTPQSRSRSVLRTPLLLAMAAYIVCGLTNDSTPGVTPLFCVFAGLAAAEAGTF